MNEGVLSPEERDALREDAAQVDASRVDAIQLGSNDQAVRRSLPKLERRFTAFCDRVKTILAKEMRCTLEEGEGAFTLINAADFNRAAARLLPGAEISLLQFGNLGLVGFNHVLASSLIDVAYGAQPGPESAVRSAPRERMTEVERQTLVPIHNAIAHALDERVFCSKTGPIVCNTLVGTREPYDLPAVDQALAYTYTFQLRGNPAECTVLLLPGSIDLLLAQDTSSVNAHSRLMTEHIEHTEVLLMALLGTTQMSLRDVADLSPGQMIWLSRSKTDHIPVMVENETKFLADPIQRQGVMGIEIFSRLP